MEETASVRFVIITGLAQDVWTGCKPAPKQPSTSLSRRIRDEDQRRAVSHRWSQPELPPIEFVALRTRQSRSRGGQPTTGLAGPAWLLVRRHPAQRLMLCLLPPPPSVSPRTLQCHGTGNSKETPMILLTYATQCCLSVAGFTAGPYQTPHTKQRGCNQINDKAALDKQEQNTEVPGRESMPMVPSQYP